jgi:hypothetical protein
MDTGTVTEIRNTTAVITKAILAKPMGTIKNTSNMVEPITTVLDMVIAMVTGTTNMIGHTAKATMMVVTTAINAGTTTIFIFG